MNYCETEHEYIDYQAQLANERATHPCDVAEGVYMLVDDASPSEPPLYFRSLQGAVDWAETDNNFRLSQYKEEETWSVYRVGEKLI